MTPEQEDTVELTALFRRHEKLALVRRMVRSIGLEPASCYLLALDGDARATVGMVLTAEGRAWAFELNRDGQGTAAEYPAEKLDFVPDEAVDAAIEAFDVKNSYLG